MRYIGVDLHTNSLTVCFLEEGQQERFATYRVDTLAEFRQELTAEDVLAVEATSNAHYFYDQLVDRVKEIVMVAPGQFDVIRRSVNKTDKNDARALAFFLSKGMLPRALEYELETVYQLEIEIIVEKITHLNNSMERLEKIINAQARQLEGYDNVISIKGIGEKSAAILLSVIGNVNEFANENKLAAYFGLVPRVSNSNETERSGRITKRGSKIGRTTLVQCALIAKKYSHYLKQFYERIKARRGTGKAIIATAKKLLSVIYYTLKNKWVFEDFPNFFIKSI